MTSLCKAHIPSWSFPTVSPTNNGTSSVFKFKSASNLSYTNLTLFGQSCCPLSVSPWWSKIPLITPDFCAFLAASTNTLYGWFPYSAAISFNQSSVVAIYASHLSSSNISILPPPTATLITPTLIFSGRYSTIVLPNISRGEICDHCLQSGGVALYHSPATLFCWGISIAGIIWNLSVTRSISSCSISPWPSILDCPKAKNI